MNSSEDMNIFIARQPIFDRKNRIYGYELLFRQNSNNCFIPIHDDIATKELIYNAFLVFGLDNLTDGTQAFINCSKELLCADLLGLLPKEKVVIEVLERGKATPATKEACERFRTQGYKLALDDFVLDEDNLPLLGLTNILKIEFPSVKPETQAALIKKYQGKVLFLAEKIETREDYLKALGLGYSLFQGYFFSKPAMVKSKDIKSINSNLLCIMNELNQPEPSYFKISDIIESDLGLSYKLLRLANSVYIGAKYKVKSITQALNLLGTREMYQWISLMMLRDMQTNENEELIKQSLIRGKLMHMLALELSRGKDHADYFFAGIFSLIDIILNKSFDELLVGLPLSGSVKKTLLGEKNDMRALLDYITSVERADWAKLESFTIMRSVGTVRFMELYVSAMKWANSLGGKDINVA